ncbi:MAG: homogentisate 1,2-dioxygenase [Legionellaceae bacterium]|nr:homogentisate 1,2-dioxygenase [Legionellaceae bacterium]
MMLSGFGNHHSTEASAGALPSNQNSPQHCPQGLFAEQINGSAFTEARHHNLHSWLYRLKPSVAHYDYTLYSKQPTQAYASTQPPNPMRWSPHPTPHTTANDKHDFIDGLLHLAGNQNLNTYLYQCTQSMHLKHRFFNNRDGELLFVPYYGEIILRTELGVLNIKPGQIAVIPRGISFALDIIDQHAAGYLCENGGAPLRLPELGPIGANGLANPRHFMYPPACFDKPEKAKINHHELICKYQNKLWVSQNNSSPLDVVAWHGNYAPYCYDLSLFNTMGTVSFDHPDPSIFTVLTSPSNTPGIAHLDFVVFPPRWMAAEHTFRPPYFHRNIMSELMGLISGEYDAKQDGFLVGGASIHNCMTPHGPDADTYRLAIQEALKPKQYKNTLAFMFESHQPWLVTEEAWQHPMRQLDYTNCWKF